MSVKALGLLLGPKYCGREGWSSIGFPKQSSRSMIPRLESAVFGLNFFVGGESEVVDLAWEGNSV